MKKYRNFLEKKTNAYELLDYLEKECTDFELRAPIDIRQILKILSIQFDEKPNFKYIKLAGRIEIKNGEPYIWANPLENNHEGRKRFTLAHELGHFMQHIACLGSAGKDKHFEDVSVSLNRDDNWNEQEMDANNFAAQILMPNNLVNEEAIKIIERYNKDHSGAKIPKDQFIKQLANIFEVSESTAEFRLLKMGINI